MTGAITTHRGRCHCGAVTFEVDAATPFDITDCNCSICRKSGFLHLIVPREQFRLLTGSAHLADYRFNTGVASHSFCYTCGIKGFYTPRSHPDSVSVNARCLDADSLDDMIVTAFDGQNWEASRPGLA